MRLSELHTGDQAVIVRVEGRGVFRKRILEMGFVHGKTITVVQCAPLRDPVYYRIMDYNVSLRREDAAKIEVELISSNATSSPASNDIGEQSANPDSNESIPTNPTEDISAETKSEIEIEVKPNGHVIRVALIGNPNCGKTSIFNRASGAHEHVGNYSGVTVEAKEGLFRHGDYKIEIIDLPGTYSLSPYSPEELYIRQYLSEETRPDLVLNVVDTCNLERNLYLTLQLKEMGLPVVIALNMFDEFEKKGDTFDYPALSAMLGIPMVPTVGRTGQGLPELFDRLISIHEGRNKIIRPIRINYGSIIEPAVEALTEKINNQLSLPYSLPARYIAVKLLEGDKEMNRFVGEQPKGLFILSARDFALREIDEHLTVASDAESIITDQRYGFIAGALKETYRSSYKQLKTLTDKIDHIVTHRVLGFPLFLLFMFIMFEATFVLGQYPMDWIEAGVGWIGSMVNTFMPDGSFKDLIVDGVIGGVGGVIVFLPNILILYFFISLMEDSGYMARAAFIMDKIMHRMGLHGKSFIPLIMGFGCNVPAIMATRTIESKQSRMITMLVTPLMSCSARLPVYLLLAGAFFPDSAGLVLFGLYFLGILLAVLLARLFKKTLFKVEDVPFVMELPPYRMPTSRSVIVHMWNKAAQYLRKMGSIILLASIVIWFLSYYPRYSEEAVLISQIEQIEGNPRLDEEKKTSQIEELNRKAHIEQQEQSYIGRFGKAVQPVLAPIGFDWKMSVSLLTGMAAKEVVVSTLGVIYTGDSDDSDEAARRLGERIREDRDAEGNHTFSPIIALALMAFVLIYFPCIATVVAIGRESGHWKWAVFSIIYSCSLAWIVSFLIYRIGILFF